MDSRLSTGWATLVPALVLTAAVTMAPSSVPSDGFRDALQIAGDYHRALANLAGKYPDQPETAWYQFQRLTADARTDQHGVDIQPCFARWWAYEFMGLELTMLSHELRRRGGGFGNEADIMERMAVHMWARAQQVLPATASACGIAPVQH